LDELLLEGVDLAVGALPLGRRRKSLHALHQDAAVPTAIEDRDQTLPRQVTPEAPEIVLRALFVGRGGDRHDPGHAGVERRRDAPDGAAFSRGVPTLEDENRRDVTAGRLAV